MVHGGTYRQCQCVERTGLEAKLKGAGFSVNQRCASECSIGRVKPGVFLHSEVDIEL